MNNRKYVLLLRQCLPVYTFHSLPEKKNESILKLYITRNLNDFDWELTIIKNILAEYFKIRKPFVKAIAESNCRKQKDSILWGSLLRSFHRCEHITKGKTKSLKRLK